MNTLVAADTQSRTLVPGQTYRLAGLVRGASASAADVANAAVQAALNQAGFTNLSYYPPSSALPADWPDDSSLPPPSSDERYFRAQGTYALSGPLPNAIAVGSGVATLYLVWSYTPDVTGAVYTAPIASGGGLQQPPASGATTGKIVAALAVAVGVIAIGSVLEFK